MSSPAAFLVRSLAAGHKCEDVLRVWGAADAAVIDLTDD
jgi:hypothetical protein